MTDSLRHLRDGVLSILACYAIAAILIWAGRQLGYPVPWVFAVPAETGLWMIWLWHDRHRRDVARALVQMGIEKGYLQ